MAQPVLLWFRRDLRLADNPALAAAIDRGGPVIPLFIWAPEEEGAWSPGSASRWWLQESLRRLDEALRRRGSRLILRRGPSGEALRELARQSNAAAVLWSRCYEPSIATRDTAVEEQLVGDGLGVETFNSALLFEPWTVRSKAGNAFRVFTPFWKACLNGPRPGAPLPSPATVPAPRRWPKTVTLAQLGVAPGRERPAELLREWQPGEAGAQARLRQFIARSLPAYQDDRDRPDRRGTSRLSPHLHFGEVSPRQVWHAVEIHVARGGARRMSGASEAYLRELGWREFAYHVLFHFPQSPDTSLRAEFARFPWKRNAAAFRAWRCGLTGYPIIDAGLRELSGSGWMHNRVRMLVASFLVKDLLVPWQLGARWFWNALVDADLANNTLGWQWTAGCGADAAPYFRVFNPVTQGERFDPNGAYVRRWLPELTRMPTLWIHKPWRAPAAVLSEADVQLGKTYPRPIVDHETARRRALRAFAVVKRRP